MTSQRASRRPDRRAVLGSGAVHVGIIVLAWLATAVRGPTIQYETVMIQIMSPPPAQAQEVVEESATEEELEIETPDPEPEEAEIPLPAQEETPPPEPTREEPTVEETIQAEEEQAATTEEPDEPEEVTGQDINVLQEGLMRDYPAYWDKIITQISMCFRGSQTQHSATVRFTVHRDGTISDLDVVESSGSLAFEVSAMEAVECAGRGRLGPLPSDFQYETLPVLFSFKPRG